MMFIVWELTVHIHVQLFKLLAKDLQNLQASIISFTQIAFLNWMELKRINIEGDMRRETQVKGINNAPVES